MANNNGAAAARAQLQTEFKGLMAQAEAIRAQQEGAGKWDDAAAKSYEQLLNSADAVKIRLGLIGREEELKDWAHSGQGAAVIGSYGAGDDAEGGALSVRPAGPKEGTFTKAIFHQDVKEGRYMEPANDDAEYIAGVLASREYKSALDYHLRNSWKANYSWAPWLRGGNLEAKQAALKVMQEGVDTSGGAWVVPEFQAQLVKKLPAMAILRPRATSITVGSDLVSFPRVVYSTDDKYTSGVRVSWTAEAPSSDISEATNPVSGRENISVYTMTAAIIMTRANMEDNQFDLLGLVSQLLAEAAILSEEDAGLNGDGVGKPQGILGHPNCTSAHSSGSDGMYVPSGVAGAMDWGFTDPTKGLVGLQSALAPQYDQNAVFVGSKATYGAIRALVDGAGRPLWNLGDQYPNMANGNAATLLGSRVAQSQFMPAISANSYSLLYGDLSGYWFADRVGVTVEVLRETRALKDEVVIYLRKRVGGQLVRPWQVKVQKCAAS